MPSPTILDSHTELQVGDLLNEIPAIGKMGLPGGLPDDVLTRMDLIMKQEVQEASNIVAGARRHGTKNQMD